MKTVFKFGYGWGGEVYHCFLGGMNKWSLWCLIRGGLVFLESNTAIYHDSWNWRESIFIFILYLVFVGCTLSLPPVSWFVYSCLLSLLALRSCCHFDTLNLWEILNVCDWAVHAAIHQVHHKNCTGKGFIYNYWTAELRSCGDSRPVTLHTMVQ